MSCKFRNAQVAQNISGKSRSNRWNLPQVAPNIYIYIGQFGQNRTSLRIGIDEQTIMPNNIGQN